MFHGQFNSEEEEEEEEDEGVIPEDFILPL
jgi:hypothetical protein